MPNVLIRSWEVRVRHVPQAQNIVADFLTKIEVLKLLRCHLLKKPPSAVRELLTANYNASLLN